ncbi:MAG: AI-2E family transporter, partial [Dethiobacteria bacterium]|nr:AI-2E family transporter [Dethiobacteria bacterium]
MLVGSQIAFVFQPLIITFEALFFSFLISGVFYYFAVPFVNWLSSRRVPRPLSISIIYLLFIGLIVLLVVLIGPVLLAEFTKLAESIPQKIKDARQLLSTLEGNTLFAQFVDLDNLNIDNIVDQIVGTVSRTLTQIATSIAFLVDFTTSIFMTIVIVPFLLYYMLKEKGSGVIPKLVERIAPPGYARKINSLLSGINRLLGLYVQGLGLVCLFVGILAYIGFLIIGLDYAMILAMFIMVTNVVPFLGPFIGAI